jgi:ribosomal protein S18 acetylase RimI-like enzyme
METRLLKASDPFSIFQQIAKIHIDEIHFSALPLLGENFLVWLNIEMTRAPQTGVWVVMEENRVLGFVSGCANLKQMYRFIFLHSAFRLFWYAGTALFSPRLLKKIPSLVLYPFQHQDKEGKRLEEKAAEDGAELLAIAVDHSTQGKGIGKILVKTFELALREWGIEKSYYVSTNIEEIGSNAFYRSAGFIPCGTQRLHDLTLQKYKKDFKKSI